MSRRRRLLGVAMLAGLLVLSGCSTLLGGGSVNQGALAADPGVEYQWDTDADARIELYRNNYTAVYRVGNRTTGSLEEPYSMELYNRDALGTDQPLTPESFQLRYENGTLLRFVEGEDGANLVMVKNGTRTDVDDSLLVVNQTRRRTQVFLPVNDSAQVAFVGPKNGKSVSTPQFVRGSYEMRLTDGARVGLPILSDVTPGGSDTDRVDDRVVVRWESVENAPSVSVRYYLERDLLLFGGLAGLGLVAGIAGGVYYYLGIRETVKRREEVGLDVDTGDDDGPGPF
jgi:hypothetical protein